MKVKVIFKGRKERRFAFPSFSGVLRPGLNLLSEEAARLVVGAYPEAEIYTPAPVEEVVAPEPEVAEEVVEEASSVYEEEEIPHEGMSRRKVAEWLTAKGVEFKRTDRKDTLLLKVAEVLDDES